MTSSRRVGPDQRRTRSDTREFKRRFMAFLTVSTIGCGGAQGKPAPARTADSEQAHVLTELLDSAEAVCSIGVPSAPIRDAVSPAQVFVEAFLIEFPSDADWRLKPGSLPALPGVPGAKLLAAPHIIATLETPRTMDLGRRLLPPGATLEPAMYFQGMTVLPRLGQAGSLVLDVDVELQIADSKSVGAGAPPETHVQNTFVVRERRVSWLAVSVPGYGSASLLLGVKPYLVRNQADLRSIFECKMQQRQSSLRQRGFP